MNNEDNLTEEQKRFLESKFEENGISFIFPKSAKGVSLGKKLADKYGFEYIELEFEEPEPEPKKKENNIQFTLDQVEDILEDLYFEEIPFDSDMSVEEKLEVFNHMPQLLQGDCIKWGCNDTEVRSEIAQWMLETQLGMTQEEWYNSEKSKQYFDNGHKDNIEIDLEKFYV